MSRDAKAASRFRGPLASERNSADLYSGLADAATGQRREVLTELAAVERRHAAHWAAKLTELGEPVPPADRPACGPRCCPGWLADSPSMLCCPISSSCAASTIVAEPKTKAKPPAEAYPGAWWHRHNAWFLG